MKENNSKPGKKAEAEQRLMEWQQKYTTAKSRYADKLEAMPRYEALYRGSKRIGRKDGGEAKPASSVRNVVYELIESQVESSVPMPKVTAVHPEDEELARKLETMLKNEIQRIPADVLNDLDERVTYTQGGDFMAVTWEPEGGNRHCSLGALRLDAINPKQVIPQPGVTDLERMDYFFIRENRTRQQLERQYHVKIDAESEDEGDMNGSGDKEDAPPEDMASLITVYYRNKSGGVGKMAWCGDQMLEDYEEYECRQEDVCKNCGAPVTESEVCPRCGCKKLVKKGMETEELPPDKQPTGLWEYPEEPGDGFGERPAREPARVPVYRLKLWPLVLRKNVSSPGEFLGVSDVEIIMDQQETIKKLGTKIDEKLMSGGSFATLPSDVEITTDDREMRVVHLETPAQKAMIDTFSLQADISKDTGMLESNYQWAKGALGITDAYQGKYDSSAQSGTAKQISAAQAAGRLESKRVMKNAFWKQIFELMAKTWLAFSDDRTGIMEEDIEGSNYDVISRWEFLRQDAAGEYYFNDEFLFGIDTSSINTFNRESLWTEAKNNFSGGAFGSPDDIQTLIRYWKHMAKLHYPNAKDMLDMLQEQLEEQQQLDAQQQMEVPPMGEEEGMSEENMPEDAEDGVTDVQSRLAALDDTQLARLTAAATMDGGNDNALPLV